MPRHSAPGRAHRQGISLFQAANKFRDEERARRWIESCRWPDGPRCPHCGSFNVQAGIKHKSMTHRCRDCPKRPMFTVRKGTVMEGTKMSYGIWAVGLYLYLTNIKGISSMRLHRELGITQKSAWFMLHRLREAAKNGVGVFGGLVEVDETYVGGKERNKHAVKKLRAGRGPVGKAAVIGAKDRETKRIAAQTIKDVAGETLRRFVGRHARPGAAVYTDDAAGYKGIPFEHRAVKHSVGEYVRDQAHTNGIESFWAMLKRGYYGIYHHFSKKHLDRYVKEFQHRHNLREADTSDQMRAVVAAMFGKRLRYADLVA